MAGEAGAGSGWLGPALPLAVAIIVHRERGLAQGGLLCSYAKITLPFGQLLHMPSWQVMPSSGDNDTLASACFLIHSARACGNACLEAPVRCRDGMATQLALKPSCGVYRSASQCCCMPP